MKLTHIRLLVDDVAKCADFYREAFGLAQRVEVPDTYAELTSGDVSLGLYRRDLMDAALGQTLSKGFNAVPTFAVDDVDATYHHLISRGASSVTQPHDQEAWVLRVAHVRDPEGNVIEINSQLKSNE
jgi:lactoylglutathione lyase